MGFAPFAQHLDARIPFLATGWPSEKARVENEKPEHEIPSVLVEGLRQSLGAQ